MVSIEINSTFFIQIGLFLVLVYILNILIFRPVKRTMEERDRNISGCRNDAVSMESEIEAKLAEYRARVEEAKQAGNEERGRLKKESLDRETEILGQAHADAQNALDEAMKRIGEERDNARAALKGIVEDMGRSIAEKAVGRPL